MEILCTAVVSGICITRALFQRPAGWRHYPEVYPERTADKRNDLLDQWQHRVITTLVQGIVYEQRVRVASVRPAQHPIK